MCEGPARSRRCCGDSDCRAPRQMLRFRANTRAGRPYYKLISAFKLFFNVAIIFFLSLGFFSRQYENTQHKKRNNPDGISNTQPYASTAAKQINACHVFDGRVSVRHVGEVSFDCGRQCDDSENRGCRAICRRSLDKFILCTAVIHEIHTKKNAPECDFCQYQILSKTQDESVETILVSGTDDNTEPHEELHIAAAGESIMWVLPEN
ncbi:hypothetical protein F2P81_003448 [Scophthalmus maximus]|uniref:Uncharacterized protein n=1 Tax=Scophthalmus maximus TaxID=52904 RepID=A0A6A4TKZ1_SCOMX|nr:hypothetical protein F2P81_003448 [Scophthalmus maximus]